MDQASLCFYIDTVEDRKMTCTQGRLDYDGIYSLKILAHFRSKVLEDFPHYGVN